jgi:amino acid transporter
MSYRPFYDNNTIKYLSITMILVAIISIILLLILQFTKKPKQSTPRDIIIAVISGLLIIAYFAVGIKLTIQYNDLERKYDESYNETNIILAFSIVGFMLGAAFLFIKMDLINFNLY